MVGPPSEKHGCYPRTNGSAMKPCLNLPVVILVGTTLLWTSCRKQNAATPMPTNAVAMVGAQVITRESFQHELTRRTRLSPGGYADPQEKEALVEEMIRFEVLHQKALAAGYDKDPQIAAVLEQMIAARYREDQLARLQPPKVTAEDIADYYRKNPERFGTPEKVRVALIEIKVTRTATPEKRAELAKKAGTLLAEARSTAAADGTFGLVAQNHSDDQASRYQGGDIGWLTVGDTNAPWDPAVLAAISRLDQPGDLAPVISTPEAFYLVKLVERQPASARPLETMKDGIAYLVARQKERQQLDDFYAALKQGLKIRTNRALLESICVPVREPRPPGVPVAHSAEARKP